MLGVLDEDPVLRPRRRLVLAKRSVTGDDDFSTHAEPEGPEDTDGGLSSPQGGDGQATAAERAPPGTVDQGVRRGI